MKHTRIGNRALAVVTIGLVCYLGGCGRGTGIGAGIPLTPPQQTFLDHEILEASHVANGMGVGPAHELVLETYPAGSNYSPEVILEFEEWFSDTILDYWGLERPDK